MAQAQHNVVEDLVELCRFAKLGHYYGYELKSPQSLVCIPVIAICYKSQWQISLSRYIAITCGMIEPAVSLTKQSVSAEIVSSSGKLSRVWEWVVTKVPAQTWESPTVPGQLMAAVGEASWHWEINRPPLNREVGRFPRMGVRGDGLAISPGWFYHCPWRDLILRHYTYGVHMPAEDYTAALQMASCLVLWWFRLPRLLIFGMWRVSSFNSTSTDRGHANIWQKALWRPVQVWPLSQPNTSNFTMSTPGWWQEESKKGQGSRQELHTKL